MKTPTGLGPYRTSRSKRYSLQKLAEVRLERRKKIGQTIFKLIRDDPDRIAGVLEELGGNRDVVDLFMVSDKVRARINECIVTTGTYLNADSELLINLVISQLGPIIGKGSYVYERLSDGLRHRLREITLTGYDDDYMFEQIVDAYDACLFEELERNDEVLRELYTEGDYVHPRQPNVHRKFGDIFTSLDDLDLYGRKLGMQLPDEDYTKVAVIVKFRVANLVPDDFKYEIEEGHYMRRNMGKRDAMYFENPDVRAVSGCAAIVGGVLAACGTGVAIAEEELNWILSFGIIILVMVLAKKYHSYSILQRRRRDTESVEVPEEIQKMINVFFAGIVSLGLDFEYTDRNDILLDEKMLVIVELMENARNRRKLEVRLDDKSFSLEGHELNTLNSSPTTLSGK